MDGLLDGNDDDGGGLPTEININTYRLERGEGPVDTIRVDLRDGRLLLDHFPGRLL